MAMMCAPLGIGLWAMVGGDNVDDLWRMAAIVGCGVGSVGAVAIWCLLSALEQIAAGLPPSWRSVSGGGAFGPVETAPLLYAPAFALVAGLVPVGLLTAVWGAKPELLSPIIASAAAVLVIAVGSVLATRQVTRTRRFAQRAQLVIEQAHATRFAMDECLPKAPGWLRLAALSGSGRVSRAAFDLFSAAWIRRFPASAVATAALTMVALLCVEPTDGPLIIGLVALAISLYSSTRADRLSVAEPKLDAAARWLGASEHVLRAGRTRLGAGLCLPAVVLIAIAVDTDAWLAVLAGALIGAITGLTLVGQLRPGGAVSWLGRSALVVALIATVWSSPNPPSGESERAPAAARRTS